MGKLIHPKYPNSFPIHWFSDTEDTKQEPISESNSDEPMSELINTEEPRKYGKFKKVVHEYTSNKIKKRILQLLRTSSIKKTEIENFDAVLRVGEHFTGELGTWKYNWTLIPDTKLLCRAKTGQLVSQIHEEWVNSCGWRNLETDWVHAINEFASNEHN